MKHQFIFVLLVIAFIGTFVCVYHINYKKLQAIQATECSLRNISEKESCIYADADGKIFAALVTPQSDTDTFHTEIRAENVSGQSVSTETVYGIDKIYKDEYNSQVVIEATNRENDRDVGQDRVIYIALQGTPPQIHNIITESGFGLHGQADWFDIPYNDRAGVGSESLVLKHIGIDGAVLNTWAFGKELVKKHDWQNNMVSMQNYTGGYVPLGAQLINGDEILLSFTGPCASDSPMPVCEQYILDPEHQTIKSIQ